MRLIKYIFRVIEVALQVLNIVEPSEDGRIKPKLEDFDISVEDVHSEGNDIIFTLVLETSWRFTDAELTDEVLDQIKNKKREVLELIRERNKYTKK